ncbi:MAG: ribonuclease III [Chloroflexota bacterium]
MTAITKRKAHADPLTVQNQDGPQAIPAEATPRAEGAVPRRSFDSLEEKLGYTFQDEDYLRNAMVHKSYLHAVPDFPLGSNERLEFLGDSILGFVVSSDLYLAYPNTPEGQLTAWRGALVRLTTLANIAEPLELGEYMYMSRGEENAGGRKRGTNLGRAVEALLGAVYLDGGHEAARDVWHKILGEGGVARIQEVLSTDYKTQLQQFTQANLRVTPLYRLVDTSGPDHAKQFRVEVLAGERKLADGTGSNKQAAEQAAAEAALRVLRAEVPVDEQKTAEQDDNAAGPKSNEI